MAIITSRLTASQNLTKGSDLYAYPAGTSFCSCASSRAALHVGSLFLRNRQPSNAPPLLLSPTGRATRRGPQMQNTLGGTPIPPRSSGATCASIGQTLRYTTGSPLHCGAPSSPHKVLRPCRGPKSPLGKPKGGFPKRGLNGAYRVPQAHLPPSPPLPRSGGGGSCPTFCLSQFSARQVPTAMGTREEAYPTILARRRHSFLREGNYGGSEHTPLHLQCNLCR